MMGAVKPAPYDLDAYNGDSGHWQFKLWADAAKTTPYPLSGKTVKAQARERPEGTQVVDLRTIVTTPNIIDLYVDETMDFPFAVGNWDLRVTDPSGSPPVRTTVLAGIFTSPRAVTDST
jgi:hypothetical protein